MKYTAMIKEIIKNVGGVDNIDAVTHCITRLRFTLKDDNKASIDGCKAIDGVVGCVNKNGQFQVVIGTHVQDVYDELVKTYQVSEEGRTNKASNKDEKMNLFGKLCDTMSGCVMPIVGPLAASGMIKALLVILTQFNIITTDTTTYQLLYMVADGVFYYLPVFLAFSSARKFGANPFLALIYGVMLVNPTYISLRSAGEPVTLFGLPVTMASYTSSVIPIILIVYFQSKIENIVKKYIPKAISIFGVPLVVSLITVPVGFVVLGPLGSIIGNYVAAIFTWMEGTVGWIVPVLVGGLCPLLVMTGMHYALGAAQSVQRASLGYATIMAPGMVCSNMAQAASSFGVALKTKDGKEFMQKYDDRRSLAPRDIVARAIDNEMKTRGDECVYLDVTHKDPEETKKHFPNIYQKCLSLGIDITKDYIPVAPAAHYLCGGIKVDLDARTSIKNLYAVGECSCTGLHGANRLASNSLIEAVVYADAAAKHAVKVLPDIKIQENIPDWNDEGTSLPEEMVLITQSVREVEQLMSAYVGIVRSNLRLKRALDRLEILYRETEDLFQRSVVTREICELRNIINVGYLIIKQAMARKESRGLHYTIDYPKKNKI